MLPGRIGKGIECTCKVQGDRNPRRQPAYIVGKDPYTLFPLPATVLNSSPWSGLRRGFALPSRQSQHGRSVPLPSIVGDSRFQTITSSIPRSSQCTLSCPSHHCRRSLVALPRKFRSRRSSQVACGTPPNPRVSTPSRILHDAAGKCRVGLEEQRALGIP